MRRPLEGLLVLDFAQFLAGPIAALRLHDLGARVIKVERPDGGELGRRLYLSELRIDGESALFQTINRGKQSFAADLKDPADRARVLALVERADVLIQNFRPGVAERIGLGFDELRARNPRLVYASVSGYGDAGPWRDLPGQDLLVQARSGLAWVSGNGDQGPVPVGISVVDLHAGAVLVQGILAALVGRGVTGEGARVDTSLLEAAVDLQLQEIGVHLNDGGKLPTRSAVSGAHPYLSAPYGIYPCREGHLALAMMPLATLADALDLPALRAFDEGRSFTDRDAIKRVVAAHLLTRTAAEWFALLAPRDIWCAEVLHWDRLLHGDAAKALRLVQEVARPGGTAMRSTRCPVRVDGAVLTETLPAPRIGEHNAMIAAEFGL